MNVEKPGKRNSAVDEGSLMVASGRKRIPLAFVSDREKTYIFSERPDTSWLNGLLKYGNAQVWNGNAWTSYEAILVRDQEKKRWLQEKFAGKYGNEKVERWLGGHPVFIELEPLLPGPRQNKPYADWLRESFDLISHGYDEGVQANPFGLYLRQRTVDYMKRVFPPGSWLLEIGCGSGIETMKMLNEGYRIHAIDASPEMIRILESKAHSTGRSSLLSTQAMKASSLGTMSPVENKAQFDGAFSNFGALDCEDDPEPIMGYLEKMIRPGGKLFLGIYNPLSLVDKICSLLELDFPAMLSRLKYPALHEISSLPVDAWFHSHWKIVMAAQRHGFRKKAYFGLGVLFPTIGHNGIVSRLSRHTSSLISADRILGGLWPIKALSDIQIILLEKVY